MKCFLKHLNFQMRMKYFIFAFKVTDIKREIVILITAFTEIVVVLQLLQSL